MTARQTLNRPNPKIRKTGLWDLTFLLRAIMIS